jgi:hypothetical protein
LSSPNQQTLEDLALLRLDPRGPPLLGALSKGSQGSIVSIANFDPSTKDAGAWDLAVPSTGAIQIASGDFNGDGLPDFAWIDGQSVFVRLMVPRAPGPP